MRDNRSCVAADQVGAGWPVAANGLVEDLTALAVGLKHLFAAAGGHHSQDLELVLAVVRTYALEREGLIRRDLREVADQGAKLTAAGVPGGRSALEATLVRLRSRHNKGGHGKDDANAEGGHGAGGRRRYERENRVGTMITCV